MAASAILKAKLAMDDSSFQAALRRASTAASTAGSRMSSSLNKAGVSIGSIATGPLATLGASIAAAFSGGAIISGVKGVFDATKGLADLSDQTGVSVGRLAVLGKAFSNAGLEGDDAGASINRMQHFLAGLQESGGDGALSKLGLTLKGLRSLRPEQQFIAIGTAISKITGPTDRTAAAMEIFGKAGARLNAVFTDPLFQSAGGELTGKAALLERNAESFSQASLKLSQAGNILKGFYVGIASGVAGPLIGVLNQVNRIDLVGTGEKFGKALAAGAGALSQAMKDVDAAQLDKVGTSLATNMGLAAGWLSADLVGSAAKFNASITATMKEIKGIKSFLGIDDAPQPPGSASTSSSPDRVTIPGSDSMFGPDQPRFKSQGLKWGQMNGAPIDKGPTFEQRGGQIFRETAGGALEPPNTYGKGLPNGSTVAKDRGWGDDPSTLGGPLADRMGNVGITAAMAVSTNPNAGNKGSGSGVQTFASPGIESALDKVKGAVDEVKAKLEEVFNN